MCGYLFDIQLNNPSRTKSLHVSSSFFTHGRPYPPSRSQLSRRVDTPYVKYKLQPITPLHCADDRHALCEAANMGLFVRHLTQQLPSNKASPYKLIFLHKWKTICSIEITSLVEGRYVLCEAQIAAYYSSSRADDKHALRKAGYRCKSSWAQLTLQGPAVPLAPWGRIELHPHTQLSSGHDFDTNCKDLGYHTKKIAF